MRQVLIDRTSRIDAIDLWAISPAPSASRVLASDCSLDSGVVSLVSSSAVLSTLPWPAIWLSRLRSWRLRLPAEAYLSSGYSLGLPDNLLDFPTDTNRAVAQLHYTNSASALQSLSVPRRIRIRRGRK